jgi:PBP1b-binding outer membrane lipoprotein LpoB
VRVKAEKDLRPELRDERLDTKYNDPATLKAVAKELNADFALVGAVNDNKQRSNDGRTVVNFYQFDMQLVNVETAEKVWIQTKQVKKVATR